MIDAELVSEQLDMTDALIVAPINYELIDEILVSVWPYAKRIASATGRQLQFRLLALRAEIARDTFDFTGAIGSAEAAQSLARSQEDWRRAAEMSTIKGVAALAYGLPDLARHCIREASQFRTSCRGQVSATMWIEERFRKCALLARSGELDASRIVLERLLVEDYAHNLELRAAHLTSSARLHLAGSDPDVRMAELLIEEALETLPKRHRPVRQAQILAAQAMLAAVASDEGTLASLLQEASGLMQATGVRHVDLEELLGNNVPNTREWERRVSEKSPRNLNIFHGGTPVVHQGDGHQFVGDSVVAMSWRAEQVPAGDFQQLATFLVDIGASPEDVDAIRLDLTHDRTPTQVQSRAEKIRFVAGSWASKVGQATAAGVAAKAIMSYFGVG